MLSPVPVMVMVWVPALAFLATLIVALDVPEPGAGMGLGLKVSPVGDDDNVIAASKPPEIAAVMVELPELPAATVIELGFAVSVKLGFCACPVSALIRPDPFGLP